jgi:hypothetical protein
MVVGGMDVHRSVILDQADRRGARSGASTDVREEQQS